MTAAQGHRSCPPTITTQDPWGRIATLHNDLAACRSATAVLEMFCAQGLVEASAGEVSEHDASRPGITARRLAIADRPATPEQRARLGVSASEPVAYRKVQLMRGSLVLSEASNWYVPGRLTLAMKARLAASDIPFGRAVAALNPSRRTLASRPYWRDADPDGPPPAVLFDYHAILLAESGQALAEVEENYTVGLLDLVRAPA